MIVQTFAARSVIVCRLFLYSRLISLRFDSFRVHYSASFRFCVWHRAIGKMSRQLTALFATASRRVHTPTAADVYGARAAIATEAALRR